MSKRVLIISPIPTQPPIWGSRAAVHARCELLKHLGHLVWFALISETAENVGLMRKQFADRFIEINNSRPALGRYEPWQSIAPFLFEKNFFYLNSIDDIFTDTLEKQLLALADQIKPDVVIVEYAFFSKALTLFPSKTLKILVTHDRFSCRHHVFWRKFKRATWFSMSTEEERRALRRADIIVAIQEREADFFKKLCPQTRVEVLGHYPELRSDIQRSSQEPHILFVGSENPTNIDALKYILGDIMPHVQQKIPQAKISIVGPISEYAAVFKGEKCRVVGIVPDLAPEYAAATVVINPSRFGTGLHIKNIESLAHGRALVTTDVGIRGFEDLQDSIILVALQADEFAEKVVSLLRNELDRHKREIAGLEYVRSCNEHLSRKYEMLLQ